MLSNTEQVVPLEQFVEQFRRLCGHIAWNFVRRSWDRGENLLTQEDAEDFASEALIRLTKCPERHRGNKWYVQRLIENAVTTAWRKRVKQISNELDKTVLRISGKVHRGNGFSSEGTDIFDELPGRDGLSTHTQIKFDYAAAIALMPALSNSQRIVLELSFGLNGCVPCSLPRIAKKLGRTEWWAQKTYQAALANIRLQLSTPRQISAVS